MSVYIEKMVGLADVTRIIREAKIKGAKDAVEEAWNAEMHRILLQVIKLGYPKCDHPAYLEKGYK